MRQPLTFDCEGARLAGVAHPAPGATGVLIVSGGVQTRVGAHRGFVELADGFAAAGFPALRFDRRGVGDSDGDDAGFRESGPDIAAAAAAFRKAFPDLRQVVSFGLCDAASALALHGTVAGLDGLILANPWTLDATRAGDLPPAAAIAARYAGRLRDPRQWLRLLSGGVDPRRLTRGLLSLLRRETPSALAADMSVGLAGYSGAVLVVLGGADATGHSFAKAWRSPLFAPIARSAKARLETIPGATHTFARREDAAALRALCVDWVAKL